MKVRFHPLAERELIAAALYLEQEAELGSDFLTDMKNGSCMQKHIQSLALRLEWGFVRAS
jgi:hypothetical protein